MAIKLKLDTVASALPYSSQNIPHVANFAVQPNTRFTLLVGGIVS